MRLIIIFFVLILNFNLYGYFEYNKFSTKSVSAGGNGVANLENSDAIFYNPALLARLKNINFAFNYNRLYPEIINNSIYIFNFSCSKYIKNGSIGVGFYNFTSDNYSEKLFVAGYGYMFSSFSIGLNLKYGIVGFNKSEKYDPLSVADNLNFYSTDIGLFYKYSSSAIGVSLLNLFSNKIGIDYKITPDRKIKLGVSQKIYKSFTLMGELNYISKYFNYRFGCSIEAVKKILEFNIGFNREAISFGISSSYKYFSIDYATEYNLNFSQLYLTQIIGMRARF